MSVILKGEEIYKSYAHISVLKGIQITIHAGEIITIVGASGAGKSTLLHILSTLEKPDSGHIFYKKTNPFSFPEDKLSVFRNRHIGFVFQYHNLLPEFTAMENVMMPGLIAGTKKKILNQKAIELLTKLGIENRAQHKPSQLSGGEAQRVAIARALINSPYIIFADEPSGNLDSTNAQLLYQWIIRMRDTYGQTFVIVTHNMDFAKMADRMLIIQDGVFQPTP